MSLNQSLTNKQLRDYIYNTSDSIHVVNPAYEIIDINPAFERLFGWEPNEVLGKSVLLFVPENRHERHIATLRELFDGHTITGMDTTRITKNGETIYVNISVCPLTDDDGHVFAVVVTTRDISKKKAFERELKESEERYRKLVELSPDLIGIHNNGEILYINKAGATMLEYSEPQEVIGKSLFDFLHPDFYDMAKGRIEAMHVTGEPGVMVEQQIRLPNGKTIDIETAANPVTYNGQVGIQVFARDITERKQFEKKLKEKEEKYRLIAYHMRDWIVVVDINGIVEYASPSHLSELGIDPDDMIGDTPFPYIHPDDHKHLQEALYLMFTNQKRGKPVEFRLYSRLTDTWLFVESRSMPILGQDGKVAKLVVVTRDITERKQAEEYFRKVDRLNVVGELAAGVAHEIRNPLTTLKGFMQMLKPSISREDLYDLLVSELDRIESIISEYLIFAKPQVVKMTRCDVREILNHVISLVETNATIMNIQIEAEYDDVVPSITCNENQLKQVFINILKNAVESMGADGQISIKAENEQNYICISVTDQGCGIPEGLFSKLGEPFYTTKEKGTGLGLMVSHKIIEAHGGTISYESEANKGTTVIVRIPTGRD